jgi:hypothetical protein
LQGKAYLNFNRYAYYSDMKKLFIQCASYTHEKVTGHLGKVFGTAMEQQQETLGSSSIWDSGFNMPMLLMDGDSVKAHICGDFTIYSPLNEPYFVVEVAYTQSKNSIDAKVKSWLTIPSMVGIVVILVNENPPYSSPELVEVSPGFTKEDWTKVTSGHPEFGPVEFNNHTWAGAFQIDVEVHRPALGCVIKEKVNGKATNFMTLY